MSLMQQTSARGYVVSWPMVRLFLNLVFHVAVAHLRYEPQRHMIMPWVWSQESVKRVDLCSVQFLFSLSSNLRARISSSSSFRSLINLEPLDNTFLRSQTSPHALFSYHLRHSQHSDFGP